MKYSEKLKMKSKPKISNMTEKNMYVKCPFCGQHNLISKTKRILSCRRCKQGLDLDQKYSVNEYY